MKKEEFIVIKSVKDVDLESFKKPIIRIFENPTDYPQKFVARFYDGDRPTELIMIGECFWMLEFDIERYTKLRFYASLDEDSCLYGTYQEM